MEKLGIQQYIEDDLNEERSLTVALDRAFFEFYETFANSLNCVSDSTGESYVKRDDVMNLIEKCFKRKY